MSIGEKCAATHAANSGKIQIFLRRQNSADLPTLAK